MKKLIVTGLITLILYKTVEPVAYSVMAGHAKKSIANNIKKVLDYYNEVSDEELSMDIDKSQELENNNLSRQNSNATFNLALNGNRLNTSLVIKYNDSLKNLLNHNNETPKTASTSLGDLFSTYLCPSFKIDEAKNYSFKKKDLWLGTAILISHVQSIPVPPPQSFPA